MKCLAGQTAPAAVQCLPQSMQPVIFRFVGQHSRRAIQRHPIRSGTARRRPCWCMDVLKRISRTACGHRVGESGPVHRQRCIRGHVPCGGLPMDTGTWPARSTTHWCLPHCCRQQMASGRFVPTGIAIWPQLPLRPSMDKSCSPSFSGRQWPSRILIPSADTSPASSRRVI